MEFKLTITLGNDAMQSGDDVADALRTAANTLSNGYDGMILPDHAHGTIYDFNGNNVGSWGVSE